MHVVETLVTPFPTAQLYATVADLDTYPDWLDIVVRTARDTEEDGAWSVELRGRIGRLTRSKRIRMVRTLAEGPNDVAFERRELDGRAHSMWRLEAHVEPCADGSTLEMSLSYDGRLWGPVLERLLRDEIAHSRTRLVELVAAGQPPR